MLLIAIYKYTVYKYTKFNTNQNKKLLINEK